MAEENVIKLDPRRRVKKEVLQILENLRDKIEDALEDAVIEVCGWPDEEPEDDD